jgi:hypothetical protein
MPGTGSANAASGIWEPSSAAAQRPAVPHPLRTLLINTESDESLITGFLLGYSDRTCAAYLADLRDFHA